jgi:hypothetical protein
VKDLPPCLRKAPIRRMRYGPTANTSSRPWRRLASSMAVSSTTYVASVRRHEKR